METYREKVAMLYEKDANAAYAILQELEALSEEIPALYPYFDEFLAMLKSEKYTIRVRGMRLLCKQAKWDGGNKIDANIEAILRALDDAKPTAVRQALKALEDIAVYKQALHGKIREKLQRMDGNVYPNTMHRLIRADMERLRALL